MMVGLGDSWAEREQTAPSARNGRRAMKQELAVALMAGVLAVSAGSLGAENDLKAPIKEYTLPTANAHPHDPALGPDGALWYTGQRVNKIGRLDPKTGAIKEYDLKTPNSGP